MTRTDTVTLPPRNREHVDVLHPTSTSQGLGLEVPSAFGIWKLTSGS